MKYFSDFINEQKKEVVSLRNIATTVVDEKLKQESCVSGVLLTGSVARGDARIGPFGIIIDLTIVLEKNGNINLDELFGFDEEPDIPYHCVSLKEKIGLGIEAIDMDDLYKIRGMPESSIYARNESIILYDKNDLLKKWKNKYFILSEEDVKKRALKSYFRYDYLADSYRFEKWAHRDAWLQITQNYNEVCECYCNFLYCINKMFIPRKDWLVYLTCEMEIKPDKHKKNLEIMYSAQIDRGFNEKKQKTIDTVLSWMNKYCKEKKWFN